MGQKHLNIEVLRVEIFHLRCNFFNFFFDSTKQKECSERSRWMKNVLQCQKEIKKVLIQND